MLATLLALAGGVLAAAGSAGAVHRRPAVGAALPWPKDPAHNIRPKPDVTDFSSVCGRAGRSAGCDAKIVRALDHARSVLGQPVYALPPRFGSLSRPDQLLVLTNDDRRLYKETPMRARNGALDKNATYWAARTEDPHGVPAIHHHPARTIGSTLALGNGGRLREFALRLLRCWMYFDGPGGPNADCTSRHSAGCWSHRHVTLNRASDGDHILMGAGTARLTQRIRGLERTLRIVLAPRSTCR